MHAGDDGSERTRLVPSPDRRLLADGALVELPEPLGCRVDGWWTTPSAIRQTVIREIPTCCATSARENTWASSPAIVAEKSAVFHGMAGPNATELAGGEGPGPASSGP